MLAIVAGADTAADLSRAASQYWHIGYWSRQQSRDLQHSQGNVSPHLRGDRVAQHL
jgi:hypothetical protein